MSNCETHLRVSMRPRFLRLSWLLGNVVGGIGRYPACDIGSMPDHLRRDIGLAAGGHDSTDRDISMMNVTLRSGIIFPRPC
jgi:hypothetical protein